MISDNLHITSVSDIVKSNQTEACIYGLISFLLLFLLVPIILFGIWLGAVSWSCCFKECESCLILILVITSEQSALRSFFIDVSVS